MAAKPVLLCCAVMAVAGCMTGPIPIQAPPPAPAPSQKVGVLLPLTGPNAGLGHDLRQAVELALGPDGPQPDIHDTAGTPAGAAAAAQAAVMAGDVAIVGPLTQGETAAAAGVAAGVPVLAFTSDRGQARAGVWPLGITPQQQAARLLPALSAAGRMRVAAVLPDNAFGQALADGLTRAASESGAPSPMVRRYPNGKVLALDAALRDVSGVLPASPPPDPNDPPLESSPPPFDALMLAESGAALRTVAAKLPGYGLQLPTVQLAGPATWAREPGTTPGLGGAWYAAADPSARAGFVQAYTARFGAPPPAFADIAYDAATLARLTAGSPGVLTRPEGFAGVDGPLALRADGQVSRGLAVFALDPGGARVIEPAPARPGS